MADEKSKTTKLKEKIMMEEPKGIKALTKREIKKADEFCKGYKKFIDNSPIEREAVRYTVELAKKAGFTEYGRNPRGFRSRTAGYQELVYMRLEM